MLIRMKQILVFSNVFNELGFVAPLSCSPSPQDNALHCQKGMFQLSSNLVGSTALFYINY